MLLKQSDLMKFSPMHGSLISEQSAGLYRQRNPNIRWIYNPWTGEKRDVRDVDSDPLGYLITNPNERIFAAKVKPPSYRVGVSFIAEVPAGAKLMAFNDHIVVVAPGMPPQFVTPTGLAPIPRADGKDS